MDCGLENRLRKIIYVLLNTNKYFIPSSFWRAGNKKTGNTEMPCKMLNNKSNLRSNARSSQEVQAHYSRYVCCVISVIACRQPKTFRLADNVYRAYSVNFIPICNVYSKHFLFLLISDELHVSYPREERKKGDYYRVLVFSPLIILRLLKSYSRGYQCQVS